MPYPTKALQEYVLKSELGTIVGGLGATGPAGPAGANGVAGANWSPVQSPTAPATPIGGTIATAGFTVSRVSPLAAVTGVILQAGTLPGQQVIVINESTSSVTMAVSATSHVSTGTACIIPAQTSLEFAYNTATALWYPAGSASGGGGGVGSGVYDVAVYDTAVYG